MMSRPKAMRKHQLTRGGAVLTTAERVRALKDEDFRLSLTGEFGDHPAGNPAEEVYVSAGQAANTCESYSSCARMCSY
ncbi:hypothetical protein SUDANB180_00031 [Streptomyces sp. enrichment culture]